MSLWLQNLYIYTDAPDINMLTNVCVFLVVCISDKIPAPQMNPADFHLSLFKLFSSESAVPTSDIQLH